MASTYRRNITKSKSGHYHLTLIDKATRERVSAGFGWGSPAQACREEETRLADRLADQVARARAVGQDLHKVCAAVAALPSDDMLLNALGPCSK